MSVYVVQREDGFDFRSTEYADLYSRADATPFQHGLWLSTLYETLAPRRQAHKLVVTVRDARGGLLLVLPLVRRRQGPLWLVEFADLGVTDYAAVVVDPSDLTALVADRDVAERIRTALGPFDLLRIQRVRDCPDVLLSLLVGARAKPHSYDAHVIDLPVSAEGWQEQLDPSFARHLQRKYKRLRPKGERRLRSVTDPAEVAPLLDRMRRFRSARLAERRGVDLLQDEDYCQFYRAVAEKGLPQGPVRLVVLEIDGEAVAVALDLMTSTTELFLLVGYDVERLRNYSLGLLIVDELVREAVDRGAQQFDLTVGDEPYKASFGAHPRTLFEIRWARTPLGGAGMVARDGYLLARRVAKRVLAVRAQVARRFSRR